MREGAVGGFLEFLGIEGSLGIGIGFRGIGSYLEHTEPPFDEFQLHYSVPNELGVAAVRRLEPEVNGENPVDPKVSRAQPP
jgi:hypothetical protein